MIKLKGTFDYEKLTDHAVHLYKRWETLQIPDQRRVILYFSALEVCDGNPVPKGEYPISGAILLDLIEEYGVTQQHLAAVLQVDRNVIFRRVSAERKARQQGLAS
jgi:hypothetical protein